mmetsp:Transcript_49680/g.120431  ORF Transcript_49680/g.120431 Transcript_49680/m.120431 type:complete len:111 (-) Transcript_49680:1427-1759(-)
MAVKAPMGIPRLCLIYPWGLPLGGSFSTEHGPFAGREFLDDLVLASQARNGVVGHERSSSDLLMELIDYDRIMEAFMAFQQAQQQGTKQPLEAWLELSRKSPLPTRLLPR